MVTDTENGHSLDIHGELVRKIGLLNGGRFQPVFTVMHRVCTDMVVDFSIADQSIVCTPRPTGDASFDSMATRLCSLVFSGLKLDRLVEIYVQSKLKNMKTYGNYSQIKIASFGVINDNIINSNSSKFVNLYLKKSDFYKSIIDKMKSGSLLIGDETVQDAFSRNMSIYTDINSVVNDRINDLYVSSAEFYLSCLASPSFDAKAVFDALVARRIEDMSLNRSFLNWCLATDQTLPELPSEPFSTRVRNRIQASVAYPFLSGSLMSPKITALVDNGEPIGDVISADLGISKKELQYLVRMFYELGNAEEKTTFLISLLTYGIPSERWKYVRDSFLNFIADRNNNNDISLYCSYFGVNPFFIRGREEFDVIDKFIRYVLRHMTTDVLAKAGLELLVNKLFSKLSSYGSDISSEPEILNLRSLIHRAIVGKRTVRGFAKDVAYCHQFLTSIEELWSELHGEHGSWEPMTEPWVSSDGRFAATPLTSVEALVEEGMTMRHCVGSYAGYCRTGMTHVYSITVDGKNAGTLQVNLSGDNKNKINKLSFSQFKGVSNSKPSSEAYRAIKEFYSDIQSSKLKLNISGIKKTISERAVAAQMDETTNEFANACKIWEIFRNTLIPSEKALSLPEWIEANGLREAIIRAAESLKSPQHAPAGNAPAHAPDDSGMSSVMEMFPGLTPEQAGEHIRAVLGR